MTKKIISMMLVVVMLISLMPAVVAEGSKTIEAPGGSFADLQKIIDEAADGDTIKLTEDYTNSGSDAEKNGIRLENVNLTIDLNGHKIDAAKFSRVLDVFKGTKVIIKNGALTGGKTTADGGAVLFHGGSPKPELTCENVKVYGNEARDGSAYYVDSSILNLIGGEICDNIAKSERPIYTNSGTTVNISGSLKLHSNLHVDKLRDLGVGSISMGNLSDDAEIWLKYTGVVGEGNIIQGADFLSYLDPSKNSKLNQNGYKCFFVDSDDGGFAVVKGTKGAYDGKYVMHKHGLWDYKVKEGNANIIVAYCKNCETYTDTLYSRELTLEKPVSCTYTGKAIEAKLNEIQAGAWQRIVKEDGTTAIIPPIVYTAKEGSHLPNDLPVDVGKYIATITVPNTNNLKLPPAVAQVEFEITPATPTIVSTSATAITYGDALSASTLSGEVNGTDGNTIDGTFTWKDSTVNPTVSDSNTTEYDVVFTPTDANNYSTVEGKVKLTVNKADSTLTAPTANTLTYDGNDQALIKTEGSAVGGTIKYSLDQSTWYESAADIKGKDAKEYTVYYKVVGDANHNDNDGGSINVTIAKAPSDGTAPTATNPTYNGNEQSIITAGTPTGGTMKYSLDQENWYNDASAIKGKNAGNYTVYYKVEADSNHNDSDVKNVVVPINPADSTFTAPTANTLTYNTNAQALVTAGSTEDGTMKYSLDNSTWSSDIPTGTNAGTYTVYYKVVGDANHKNNAGGSVKVTIEKAAPAYTAPAAKSDLAYTGSDIELITAGSTDDGKMQYKLGTGEWSTDASAIKGKNVETYTVYYQVLGDSNHKNSEMLSLNVTVGKSNSVLTTAPTAKTGLTCSSTEQQLVNAGTASNGTLYYKLNNGEWGTNVPTAKTAGTYTVYYKVAGDTGYNDIAQSSITVTISHKYDQDEATAAHFCSAATCTAKAKYYCSCVCGKNGTATFEDGNALGHDMQNVTTNKSGASTLKTPATCTTDAVYNQACSRCGLPGGTPWTATGSKLGHDYGDWQQHNDTQHKKVCNNDASHVVYENHDGMEVDGECDTCHYKTPDRKLKDTKEDAVKKLEEMLKLEEDAGTIEEVRKIIEQIKETNDPTKIEKVIELREQGLDMIHICRGSHKIEPKEGTFTLKTGGKSYGEYKFTPSNGGWIISKNGNVISGKGGDVWFYQNGVFYQTTTERVSRGFFLWNVLFGRKTVTNTYYLCVSGNTVTAGTKSTQFEIWESFSNKDHTPAYAAINNHQHRIYCYYCGVELGVENCTFEDGHCTKCVGQQASPGDYIKVSVKTHTTNLLFWKLYYADISAVSDIVGIKKIQYSVGETGLSYQTGTKVISTKKIDKLVIVVTATDGPHGFLYDARTGLVTRYDLM